MERTRRGGRIGEVQASHAEDWKFWKHSCIKLMTYKMHTVATYPGIRLLLGLVSTEWQLGHGATGIIFKWGNIIKLQ